MYVGLMYIYIKNDLNRPIKDSVPEWLMGMTRTSSSTRYHMASAAQVRILPLSPSFCLQPCRLLSFWIVAEEELVQRFVEPLVSAPEQSHSRPTSVSLVSQYPLIGTNLTVTENMKLGML